MTRTDTTEPLHPPPVRLSRLVHAHPQTVFAAWTAAEHVRRWFCPDGFSVPEAVIEARPGGAFEVCMQAPDGTRHWSRGTFLEVAPPRRLVIEMLVTDAGGRPLFRARTEAAFAEALGGTQLEVVQTYVLLDPAAVGMIGGAAEGWRMTLDKLARTAEAMQGGAAVAARSVVHASFNLERTYAAPVGRVWRALTDIEAKAAWFAGTPGQWELLERVMEVRPGGRERLKGRWGSGTVSTFEAVYFDVVPNERLVYAYEMHLNEKKISVSLATMQLKAQGARTTLLVTEQGAFLDGYDDAGSRERGTGFLLDALGAALTA